MREMIRTAATGLICISLLACGKSLPAIPEEKYSDELVGGWQGTAGENKEFMSIKMNGHFVCELHERGFIANTLSQGVEGTVSGTWSVAGKTLTLAVDGTKNEHLMNGTTSSEIVSFNNKVLVLKSDRGGSSTFYRSQ